MASPDDYSSELRTIALIPIVRRVLGKCRFFTFSALSRLAEPHYASFLSADARTRSGRKWRQACNHATSFALNEMFTEVEGYEKVEIGNVPACYTGAYYFGEAQSSPPTAELATGLVWDMDRLTRRHETVFGHIRDYQLRHMQFENNWRFLTAQTVLSSFYLKCVVSRDPVERAIAQTWRLKDLALPANFDEISRGLSTRHKRYDSYYEGDAEAEVEREKITICSPWLHEEDSSIKNVQGLLDRVVRCLPGHKLIVCSPWGYKIFKARRGKWPW
jgi:hypothetical protein